MTSSECRLRANQFAGRHPALPQLALMVNLLKVQVEEELWLVVVRKVLNAGWESDTREYFCELLKFLSKVVADKDWDEAARQVDYVRQQAKNKIPTAETRV